MSTHPAREDRACLAFPTDGSYRTGGSNYRALEPRFRRKLRRCRMTRPLHAGWLPRVGSTGGAA